MAAAAVVSVAMGVMKPVLDKLTTLMGDEYKKIKGLRKAVTFLQRELGEMDALLEKMDSVDELDPQAKKWRRDIIEMSYNVEDRIDDFMHSIGEADDKTGILRKAAKYLKTFKDRHRLANEFQEIKTLVTEASDRRKRYMLDKCISVATPVVVDPRMKALYKESASLVGLESQKDKLVSWATDDVKQLKFMAIVGFGGIGKTTLANEVYREIGGKFQCTAFISVSQKPDIIVLLNSLLEQLGLQKYSYDCLLKDLIDALQRHLQDKRYFIVIDDLWDMKIGDDAIQCAFPQSDHSSRVIITTRNENVAAGSCRHNNGKIHNMKHLSKRDSSKLFFDRIFGSEDACPAELMEAPSEILKKCDGLPLAIITMASMLAYQPRELEAWEYILKSLGTKSAPNSTYEDMIYILDLSYKNLPRHLKACFLYLGSYPEDYEIDRDELVRRWVAEGFVSNSDGKHDVWDVAESYFNELVNRSMIQPTYVKTKYFSDDVSGCRVHDMLLELIVMRCKEDNFLSLVNDVEALVEAQDNRFVRRLTVASSRDAGGSEVDTSIIVRTNISQIRSLAILGESNWVPPLKFKYIRVFILKIPYRRERKMDVTWINQLLMLRYLEVDANVTLPAHIQGMQCLETLDLSGVREACNVPTEINDVPRLSHLVMPAEWMWNMTGKMKLLHTLRGFSVPPDSSESIVGLGELTALSDLRFYFPSGWGQLEKKIECMTALSVSLEKLCNLKRLCVYTMKVKNALPTQGTIAWCADELCSLSPTFRKLERLSMRGCRFSRVPKWIGHLQKLRFLYLGVKQIFQEDVAIIGRGSSSLILLSLRITSIPTERIVIGGSTGFPHIKVFDFDCDGISHLTFEEGAMPELRLLSLVFDADKWDNAAPGGLQHLPSLKEIEAWWPNNITCRYINTTECEEKGRATTAVFQEASGALLTRPAFDFSTSRSRVRHMEEDDYLMKQGASSSPQPRSSKE